MNFACISLPFPGHINPMAALARELVRRGHTATFFHYPDVEAAVRQGDVAFVPLGSASFPAESMSRAMRDAGNGTLWSGYRRLIGRMANATAMLCEELPRAIERHSIDMILCDQLEAAGGLVAYHMNVPHISVAAALPINWERGIPAPFVGWKYGEKPWHRRRNSASAYGVRITLAPISKVIETVANRWHLRQGNQVENYLSGFAQISQLTPGLDFPRRQLTECFHYCGPLRDPDSVSRSVAAPGRQKRAFASLGTLQGHRARLFTQIARSAAKRGLHLIIAHGNGLTSADAERLSRTADVHAFVAQDRIMAVTDVAILHGGLNTVLDALAQGVPIVLIPLAFEQGAIAARVERSGAGRICRSRFFRQQRLSALTAEVLDNPAYAQAAAKLKIEILAAGGAVKAADIVEHVLTTGCPCINDAIVKSNNQQR